MPRRSSLSVPAWFRNAHVERQEPLLHSLTTYYGQMAQPGAGSWPRGARHGAHTWGAQGSGEQSIGLLRAEKADGLKKWEPRGTSVSWGTLLGFKSRALKRWSDLEERLRGRELRVEETRFWSPDISTPILKLCWHYIKHDYHISPWGE